MLDVKSILKEYYILICINEIEILLSFQEMRRIKKFMMTEDTHKDSNCFALTVICHGNDRGHLLDRNKKRAWITEDIVGDLSEVDNLRGKPKLFVVQACRGRK